MLIVSSKLRESVFKDWVSTDKENLEIHTNDKDSFLFMYKAQRKRLFANFLPLHSMIIVKQLILCCCLSFVIILIWHPLHAMALTTISSSSIGSIANTIIGYNVTQTFHQSYERLINDSHLLTQSYQGEIGKWLSKQYNNNTMIKITDEYLPKFQKLIDRAESLKPTADNYNQAKGLYIKSLQSEMESYRHFRNFLTTGNHIEDEKSTQLLSDALRYEFNSFAAFNNQTKQSMDNDTDNHLRI